jgi:microcystin-dependent protein
MLGTLAEIRMFAGNFAPRSWLLCNGQLLSIAQWSAVFALVGTTYGGDGQVTFGVPDFRGRIAVGLGTGPGLPTYQLGEMAGTATKTLVSTNLPFHNHPVTGTVTMQANTDGVLSSDPTGRRLGAVSDFTSANADLVPMAPAVVSLTTAVAGNNQPFSSRSPYLGMNYVFCIEGIFPSRD